MWFTFYMSPFCESCVNNQSALNTNNLLKLQPEDNTVVLKCSA